MVTVAEPTSKRCVRAEAERVGSDQQQRGLSARRNSADKLRSLRLDEEAPLLRVDEPADEHTLPGFGDGAQRVAPPSVIGEAGTSAPLASLRKNGPIRSCTPCVAGRLYGQAAPVRETSRLECRSRTLHLSGGSKLLEP